MYSYWRQNTVSIFLWMITIIYMIGIVLMHRRVNEFVDLVKKMFGLSSYLLVSRLVGLIVILCVLFWLYKRIAFSPGRLKVLLLFIPLALIADLSLIVVPIERIHYFQYGLLTGLCYASTGKAFQSALMAFLVGVVDESYQYWALYAEDPEVYFDWNDIVLNLMGVLAILLFFLPVKEPIGRLPRKPIVTAIFLWILVVYLLVFLLNPDQYLVRNDPYKGSTSFWIASNINTHYHVMNALEGLIVLGILLILTVGYYLPRQPRVSPI